MDNISQALKNSLENDPGIKPQTYILYVFSIPVVPGKNTFIVNGGAMISFYLRQSRNAWSYQGSEFISGDNERKSCTIGDHMRPWPNDTHLANKHIKKLREFIHICSSQESSHSRDPVIIFISLFFIGLLIDDHRSEFQAAKRPPFFTNPPLDKKNRSFGIKYDKQACDG